MQEPEGSIGAICAQAQVQCGKMTDSSGKTISCGACKWPKLCKANKCICIPVSEIVHLVLEFLSCPFLMSGIFCRRLPVQLQISPVASSKTTVARPLAVARACPSICARTAIVFNRLPFIKFHLFDWTWLHHKSSVSPLHLALFMEKRISSSQPCSHACSWNIIIYIPAQTSVTFFLRLLILDKGTASYVIWRRISSTKWMSELQ